MRAHLAEFGSIVAKGSCHIAELLAKIADVLAIAQPILHSLADQLRALDEKISPLDELALRPPKRCTFARGHVNAVRVSADKHGRWQEPRQI